MSKITFKFTASVVDAIEKRSGESIGNAVSNNTVGNITNFIELAHFDGDKVGVSRSMAMKKIDEYLEEKSNDLDDLVLDITEQLVEDGFLSRGLSVEKMRELKKSKIQQVAEVMENELNN
ncbi:hypothetical protein ERUR111494_02575 [Erysipelothrix urinaevulpis]|uniref:hypothetical protein n=1 Tax=Erysipelothrix urinaevulpis TaxID=2683717 RepID=UPI00135BF712|nr:hypothetical protein [Erysipelothrix urinaevulpis]